LRREREWKRQQEIKHIPHGLCHLKTCHIAGFPFAGTDQESLIGDRGINSKYIKVTYKNKKTFNSILAKR
jgi:hypothetical protein